MKKKIIKKNKKEISFSDLYAMYLFVSSYNNYSFGAKTKAKLIFKEKLAELEKEIHNRVFGKNPFDVNVVAVGPSQVIDISGIDPIKVIGSFTNDKTFVVARNEENQ